MSDHHHQTAHKYSVVTKQTVHLYIIISDDVLLQQCEIKAAVREVDFSK